MSSTSAATSIFKPLSVADSTTHLSLPSIFITTKPYLPLPPRPFKLHLSCSHSSPLFLSLKSQKTHFTSVVSFVSPEDDNNNTTVTLEQEDQETEETTWENQESETEANLSEWETEGGEDAVIEGGESEGESAEGGVYESGLEEEPVELPEDAKLFVGNLPYDVHSQDLAMLFEKAGIVEIAEVIYNRETDQSRGFGFVTMSTVEEAEKAVELFHKYELNGRLLTVNKAAPRGTRPERPPREFEPGFRIYVGNLPWDVDNARLEQVFSEHGKVTSARVVYDRETGRSRGFGFVTMTNENEMNDAIAALDGQSLDGRAIRVNVAEERPRRSF